MNLKCSIHLIYKSMNFNSYFELYLKQGVLDFVNSHVEESVNKVNVDSIFIVNLILYSPFGYYLWAESVDYYCRKKYNFVESF